jgi:hypothetical protein
MVYKCDFAKIDQREEESNLILVTKKKKARFQKQNNYFPIFYEKCLKLVLKINTQYFPH